MTNENIFFHRCQLENILYTDYAVYLTKKVGLAVVLWTSHQEMHSLSVGASAIPTEVFRGFLQSLQANVRITPQLEHYHVHTNSFLKSSISLDITECIPFKVNSHFGGTYNLHIFFKCEIQLFTL
jgi:hypothetical protein